MAAEKEKTDSELIMDKLIEMPMHGEWDSGEAVIHRVPGGWVYRYFGGAAGDVLSNVPVFVPLPNQIMLKW